MEKLKQVKGISEAYHSKGFYDAVALVEANSMDDLKQVISKNIRIQENVKATLTLSVLK